MHQDRLSKSAPLYSCEAIWDPKPMSVFSVIGFLYAFGDYLELKSLGSLSGPTYQVLSQSKLLITAGMLYGFKGQKQSPLQWILLVLLMLSLCCYSIMGDLLDSHRKLQRDSTWKAPEGGGSAFGMFMAVLKVVVSCLCAVLSDKYMKDRCAPLGAEARMPDVAPRGPSATHALCRCLRVCRDWELGRVRIRS